jgi:hypothetical protein
MAHVAYERLSLSLQAISTGPQESLTVQSVEALQDAWSIVDSVNRFRDLLANLPGLKTGVWTRLFSERTADAAALRNCMQHQLGELDNLISNGGQVWGYLSWAKLRAGKPTGQWYMLSGGSDYVGDRWLFIGPATLPFPMPLDRVRLNAYGRQVYLWRIVDAVVSATRKLETELTSGNVRPVGNAATERRGADAVYSGSIEVVVSNLASGSKCP